MLFINADGMNILKRKKIRMKRLSILFIFFHLCNMERSERFISRNPRYREVILDKIKKQHFMHHIGFSLDRIEAGFVTGQMKNEEHIRQQTGFLHGGATATFADLVMGFAAYSLVSEEEVVVTSDLKISYLNPGVGSIFRAEGQVIKNGKKLIFCEAEIYADHFLIAKASATMAVVSMQELIR